MSAARGRWEEGEGGSGGYHEGRCAAVLVGFFRHAPVLRDDIFRSRLRNMIPYILFTRQCKKPITPAISSIPFTLVLLKLMFFSHIIDI